MASKGKQAMLNGKAKHREWLGGRQLSADLHIVKIKGHRPLSAGRTTVHGTEHIFIGPR